MTKEEIIELAREAGVRDDENIFEFSQYKYLEAFAKLVAEKAIEPYWTIRLLQISSSKRILGR